MLDEIFTVMQQGSHGFATRPFVCMVSYLSVELVKEFELFKSCFSTSLISEIVTSSESAKQDLHPQYSPLT